MTATGNSFSSANIGKSSLIYLEDDSSGVSSSKGIITQSNISNFIDDRICQDNSWQLCYIIV